MNVKITRNGQRTDASLAFRCDIHVLEWLEEHGDTIGAEMGRGPMDDAKEERNCDER